MTMWNSWETVASKVGSEVIIKLKHPDGRIGYESAFIHEDDGDVYYVFFDGDSYNTSVVPLGWMDIPNEVQPVTTVDEKIGHEVIVQINAGEVTYENVELHMIEGSPHIMFPNGDYNVSYEITGWIEIPE